VEKLAVDVLKISIFEIVSPVGKTHLDKVRCKEGVYLLFHERCPA